MTLTSRDSYGFELAIKAAKMSECHFMHGACILRGNRVITLAHNITKSHPIQVRYLGHVNSIHAEFRAIKIARTDLRGCVCYSAHVRTYTNGRKDRLCNSKPCATCATLLREFGIAHVVYYQNGELINERYV